MAIVKTNIIARFADVAAIQAGVLEFECGGGFKANSVIEGINLSTGDSLFSKSDGALSFKVEKPTARSCKITLLHSIKKNISPNDRIQIAHTGRGRSSKTTGERLTEIRQAAVSLAATEQDAAQLGDAGCDFFTSADGVVSGNWFSVTCLGNTTFAASTAVVNGSVPPTDMVIPVGVNIVTDFTAISLSGGSSKVVAYRRSREDITSYTGG